MNPTRRFQVLAFALLCAAAAPAWGWVELCPGLEHRSGTFADETAGEAFAFDAVRVDPHRLRLRVIDAASCCGGPATVKAMAQTTGALAVINGGFFDERTRPLGLVVADGIQKNPSRPVSWWGVFFVADASAGIALTGRYHPRGPVDQALQCGPRLLVNGKVPTDLKRQVSRRSVVALDSRGRVILLCTGDTRVSASSLGRFLGLAPSRGGMGCRDALNLDGGPSAQLYLAVNETTVHSEGGWPTVNGIGVFEAPPPGAALAQPKP